MVLRFPSQPTRQQMEQVLQIFLSRTSSDPALNEYAFGKMFTIQYILPDLELAFFLILGDGEVKTGMGTPPEPVDVRLRADLEVLNGIFTGEASPTRSLMNGKLSFSGDLRRMSDFQRIQPDLAHLYRAACRDAGVLREMGDFDPNCVGIFIPQVSSTDDLSLDPRLALVNAVTRLYKGHLVTSSGGNVSVRIPGVRQAWITPYQLYLENISPESMVRIDFEGNTIEEGSPAPCDEFYLHTEIYKARSDIQAVVHAHSQYATILSMNEKIVPLSEEASKISNLPRVSYSVSGKTELAEGVVRELANSPAVLLQNHGVVVAGKDLNVAMSLLEAIERASQMILQCNVVGKRPPTMPREMVKALREIGNQYNGSTIDS